MRTYDSPVCELLTALAEDILTLSNDKGLSDIFFNGGSK